MIRKSTIHGSKAGRMSLFSTYEPLSAREEDDIEQKGVAILKQKYEHEITLAMNFVAALCVSFLTVQGCRFTITGVLPDNVGVEEEHWKHTFDCSVKLAACTVISFVGLVGMVQVTNTFPEHVTPGTWESMMKRAAQVAQLASAMAMAWCLLFTARWEQGRNFNQLGSPNTIMSRMVLAVMISIAGFFGITLLDKLADRANSTVEEAIRNVISSVGILVGFSWEGAFEGGVDVLAERAFPSHPVITHLLLAAFVSFVVITPWRRHILQKVIDLERERTQEKHLPDDDAFIQEEELDCEEKEAEAEEETAKPFSTEGSSLQSEPKARDSQRRQSKQPKWVDEQRTDSFLSFFGVLPFCCKNAEPSKAGPERFDTPARYPQLATEAGETPA
jgi:hypothetical protein